ncbi:MAG: DUF3613 domain-containing protein [Gammaproteobacteria bacterium]|jgi:hypothetical protein|nr:MAG: DUF3613 domain-containing protein [Gammaproteobacteria bacterium]
MKVFSRIVFAVSLIQVGVVFAGQEEVATAYPLETSPAAVGDGAQTATESWLRAQSSGRLASPHLQRATLEERELANQRLLDSYRHPIPDFFDEDVGGKVDE